MIVLNHDLLDWTIVLAAWVTFHVIYTAIAAAIAFSSGAAIEEISIGFSPTLFRGRLRSTVFRIGALPIGSYVKLVNEDSEIVPPDGRLFDELSLITRLCILLLGHFVVAGIGYQIAFGGPRSLLWAQVGLLGLGVGIINLLPIPVAGGFQALTNVCACGMGLSPRQFSERFFGRWEVVLCLVGILVMWTELALLYFFLFARFETVAFTLSRLGFHLDITTT